MYRLVFLLLIIGLIFSACKTPASEPAAMPAPPPPQNIILLIGDGMGLAQVSTAYYFQDEEPSFSRFQSIGFHISSASSHKITDSAAGATAFSAGVKTYNGAIGVNPDTVPVPTILEWAAAQGKRTGLVATSSITHATPASFYAHVRSRNMAEDIATDLLNSDVDFFAGGGYEYFANRKDEQDYVAALQGKGFTMGIDSLPPRLAAGDKYGFLLADDGMPKMQEGRGAFLPKATQLALEFLDDDPDGFFLMVEGSQIDWGGHDNDGEYIVQEVQDFDRTINLALDFAKQHGNTLVIVTADHETGGLSLSSQKVFGRSDYNQISLTFSTGGHSASLIPVFAYGPGEELFQGIYQNSAIYHKMMEAWGQKTEVN